jgi:signal transduction histidine kinase
MTAPTRRRTVDVVSGARASRRQPVTPGELAVAGGFAAVSLLLVFSIIDDALLPAAAVAVLHSGVLAWRKRAPEVVVTVQGLTAGAVLAAGWPPVILGPAVVASAYALGVVRPRPRAVPVLAAILVVMAGVVLAGGARFDTVVGNAAVIGVGWWLGDRQRRVAERADHAEREAEARAARAAADERLRIARELHDVVAHALSVISVQAGTGRVLLDSDPATARAALSHIEAESRAALGEMRRLVGVLRVDDDGRAESTSASLAPAPTLDDLDELIASTVRAGLPVEVRVEGDPRPLPAGAEVAAYRIVQEALTNVRRHAHASRVQVVVAWRPHALEIDVVDDGRGRSRGERDGNGLIGMRERAAVYGGGVVVENRPGGGHRVGATIPWEST